MRRTDAALALAATAVLAAAAVLPAFSAPAPDRTAPPDRLAAEIARLSAILKAAPEDDFWKQIQGGPGTMLGRAEQALHDGRRNLALQRMGFARSDIASAAWTMAQSEKERSDVATFEAAWERLGREREREFRMPAATAFDGVRPAFVRGLAEAAAAQAGTLYRASLDYGRSTEPLYGLFYAGTGVAQVEYAAFLRGLSDPKSPAPPRLRSFAPELDALEDQLLKAYKPPVSIDRHGEFITASASLKEARELDAAGLRYGALVKLLDATMRAGVLASAPDAPAPDDLAQRLQPFEKKINTPGRDHSIGRTYLEGAQANLPGVTGANPTIALSIVRDVLPRYFAALEPAPRQPARPKPEVTVTLVRWPYT
ncbi:MAG TPA: hypothetical protein VFQ07_11955 [Candidatus Polarisedimenticolia bacterium]|nr:hypothetical protein [Candidatus Polarisedimenticolia bacterium]